MKEILFSIVFGALTLSVSSQEFIQENKSWNVVTCFNLGTCYTEVFVLNGDTTIGATDYTRLYVANDHPDYTSLLAYGALREDENKVYFYSYNNEAEVILYDFDLEVGETFSSVSLTEFGSCPYEMEVTAIDTVTLENGELRQRFHFADTENTWIAGIGSMNGVIYDGAANCITDITYSLSCCRVDEIFLFQSPILDACVVHTVGLSDIGTQIHHSLYPNPFSQSTSLIFDDSGSQKYHLKVFSSTGKVAMEIENIRSGEVIIDGDRISPGIYFYILTNSENETAIGKFIKQ